MTAAYSFQWVSFEQLSDTPWHSVVPVYVMPTRPGSPAMTSGNTVLVTDGRLTWACGAQNVPGLPPMDGLFALSSMGEKLYDMSPPVIQTA